MPLPDVLWTYLWYILGVVFLIHTVAFALLYRTRKKPRYLALVGTFIALTLMTWFREHPSILTLGAGTLPASTLLRIIALLCTAAAVALYIRDRRSRHSEGGSRPPSDART